VSGRAERSRCEVDERTDELASHAAHFLGMTKKQYVAEAVAYYTEHRRAEIEDGVKAALASLDGSREADVRLLTGLTAERIEELGGIG
jgi:hypothetical protein